MQVATDRFICPIPPAMAAGADEVHDRSLEWAARTGLVDDTAGLAAMRFGDLACRAYPRASVDDRVLITGWLMYVAVLDDQFDHAEDLRAMQATFRQISRYLRTGRFMWFGPRAGGDQPLLRSLASLWRRTSAPMPPIWQIRFAQSMNTFLAGVTTEARYRQAGRRLSLDEYLGLRRDTSACHLLFDLIQLAGHQPLPDAIHLHPGVDAVRTTAVDVVAWINDLASMDKEEAAGSDHNLVLTVRRTGGLSAPLARAVATDMVNDGIARLWADSEALPDFGAGLTDYLAGLRFWVRANMDWSARSGRYQVPAGA